MNRHGSTYHPPRGLRVAEYDMGNGCEVFVAGHATSFTVHVRDCAADEILPTSYRFATLDDAKATALEIVRRANLAVQS